MNDELADDKVAHALKECATEPVHIPGAIQPIGVLLGSHIESGEILHASANATDLFGCNVEFILGKHLRDLLGDDIWHSSRNFLALQNSTQLRLFAGMWQHHNDVYSVSVSKGGDFLIFEIESEEEKPRYGPELLREQTFLTQQIQSCRDEETLFSHSCQLLRHITGFDRVLVYQFDAHWNGIVRAEARKSSMESFEGLRFPHWDIPEQAREIMARIQLRLICDTNNDPVPIVSSTTSLPPLDISLAQCRAASAIHMQYLRNMGSLATMTLSVVLEGKLWGMISFHHQRPKCSSPQIRQMLTSGILPTFCMQLNLLRYRESDFLSRQLYEIQSDIQIQVEKNSSISDLLSDVGPIICKTLTADGLAIVTGSNNYSFGKNPTQELLDQLVEKARADTQGMLVIEALSKEFPHYAEQCEGLAGVLAISKSDNRCLLFFRSEINQHLTWAGNPSKTIESVDGNNRLLPRGSFSRYLEIQQGRSKAWSEQDRHLVQQLWPLLSAAERQIFISNLSRKQTLMISELNHRVRNILALVKSVTKGAHNDTVSIEHYCQTIESRILALATAHDLGVDIASTAVSVKQIFALETQPFDSNGRFNITGDDIHLRAELTPILALVFHELITNAVKHGALSTPQGSIDVEIRCHNSDTKLIWIEKNGPPVKEPSSLGFGTTLINQAIPFELGGTSNIEFMGDGLRVTLGFPLTAIEKPSTVDSAIEDYSGTNEATASCATTELTLVLEDNFLIANAMVAELEGLGFSSVEMFASEQDALHFLESQTPGLAVLDLNLGQGKTSHEVASKLMERGVPTIFVSGYGDRFPIPPHLSGITTLTKPVSSNKLKHCLAGLLGTDN